MQHIGNLAGALVAHVHRCRCAARGRDLQILVPGMVEILVRDDVDLGDERAVFAKLMPLYGAENVVEVMDEAIDRTRKMRAAAPDLWRGA